jgi:hypothetical protein
MGARGDHGAVKEVFAHLTAKGIFDGRKGREGGVEPVGRIRDSIFVGCHYVRLWVEEDLDLVVEKTRFL